MEQARAKRVKLLISCLNMRILDSYQTTAIEEQREVGGALAKNETSECQNNSLTQAACLLNWLVYLILCILPCFA